MESGSSGGHGIGQLGDLRRYLGLALAAASFSTCLTCSVAAQDGLRLFTIGGAGLNGNYYSFAKTLCQHINGIGRDDVRCSPESTPGSLYNLRAMQRGELDFALVQSDWQKKAVAGIGPFAGSGPMTGLRSVASLYQEALTFAVRRESDIHSLDDLGGKVLDIGHPSTGRYAMTRALADSLKLAEHQVVFTGLIGQAATNELCAGTVDATMLVIGHPNPEIANVVETCDLVLLPVAGPAVDAFLNKNPEYIRYNLPSGTYQGMDWPVASIAVTATLVVRDDIPDDIVSLVLWTLIEDYRQLASTLNFLPAEDPLGMNQDGLSAPMHPGASAVYDEFARRAQTVKP